MPRAARRAAVRAPAVALALAFLAAPAAALDLIGTWHVLVHYKDAASENPETERWDDRIWVFERDGTRMRWTEYPIVVFSDESGRFERTARQYARTLHFWEPNERQLSQIRSGLEINERGSRSKTLSGSASDGWRSASPAAAFGGNVLTYTESWSVSDPSGLPVFRMEDSLSGTIAETLEGVTEYRASEVSASGDEVRGSYARDGTRTGTFRLTRSGAVSRVRGSKTQAEMRQRLGAQATLGGAAVERILTAYAAGADRAKTRTELVRAVGDAFRAQGLAAEEWQAEIEGLADLMLAEIDRGTSAAEVQRRVREGELGVAPPP
jgi:hypothetical protein